MAVLGGGPAGAATALALRRHQPSLAVTLVEGGAYETPRVGETLPPAVRPLLDGLGVWRSFVDQAHLASRGTSAVWGPPGGRAEAPPSDHDFLLSPQAEGWHLDRARFDRWLAGEAAAAGCELLLDATYLRHRRGERGGWRLTLRRGGEPFELAARHAVDATGRRAAFARRAGAVPVVFDDLLGVFRWFEIAPPGAVPSTHALVEAVEGGWWYAARLPGERLLIGAFADADGVAAAGLREPAGWWRGLEATHHVRAWVAAAGGGEHGDGPPSTHPAGTRHLHPFAGDGWLAVGDAATCYDPLSSQGILKALRFARLAAYATADALAGDAAAAARYAAWVRNDFEGYLAARSAVYRRERRWPDSPFWRRRHGEVTIDPQRLLGAGDTPLPRPARHLPPADLARLRDLCTPPATAHEVVRRYRETTPDAPSSRRLILALQCLLETGALK